VKITDILPQKKNQDRFNLYIDGEFFCGISSLTLARENLYKDLDIGEERLNEVIKEDLENRVFDRVAQNISNSPKTEFQIRRYIKDLFFKKKGDWFSKGIDIDESKILENVITRLKDYHFLDDESYARMFVESRIKNKPRGKIILINELRTKGISKNTAQKICDELVDDESSLLKKIYAKKYGDEEFTRKDTKKIQYLQRKGFSWDLIQTLISDDIGE
jgi:regulatory protein